MPNPKVNATVPRTVTMSCPPTMFVACTGPTGQDIVVRPARQTLGASPRLRLNARLNASSES